MRYFAILLTLFLYASATAQRDDDLRINQIQIIASHNSYHMRTDPAVMRFMKNLYALHFLPRDYDPRGLDYTNAPLTEQLDKYGLRGIELDVYYDPTGGRFYYRRGRGWVWRCSASKIEALKQPGFKILHIPDFDYNSTNVTFKDALIEVKKWSDAHPSHLPLYIHVEPKTDAPGDKIHQLKKLAHSLPFDSAAADALDAEVRSVFGNDLNGVITPDQVRGNAPTLEQAILTTGWPTLAAARGKILFIIDCGDEIRGVYTKGHPSYRGRAMFTYAPPGTPEAAFVIHNDAEKNYNAIQRDVKKGYIIRTRTDEGTVEARTGDYGPMHRAMASWGQILSTDYYRPDARAGKKGWTNYQVRFPEGIARLDSISAGKEGVVKE